jgi:hypothetical protein
MVPGEKRTNESHMDIWGGELVSDFCSCCHVWSVMDWPDANLVGRHPCAGMKMAKLELKMIVAMFVVGYEYDVVDSEGRISTKVPVPNYNEQQQVCFALVYLEIGTG